MATKFEKLKQQLKERNNKRPQSFLEEKFERLLKNIKIFDYEKEYQVDYYFIDFAFSSLRIGIELDGKEWHTEPEKDRKKDNYLKNNGWVIHRFDFKQIIFPEYEKRFYTIFTEIYNKLYPSAKTISWGLKEILGKDFLYPNRKTQEPLLENCEKCGQFHDLLEECIFE